MKRKSSTNDAESWQKIAERLHNARIVNATISEDTIERDRILSERAHNLAQPIKLERVEVLDLLLFSLADGHYAIENKYVQEVCKLSNLTTIPLAPVHLTGLTNLKGEIVTVFDISPFLTGGRLGLAQLNCLIVLGLDKSEFAILANSLDKQINQDLTEILPLPENFTGASSDCIKGITNEGVIILDGLKILADARLHIA